MKIESAPVVSADHDAASPGKQGRNILRQYIRSTDLFGGCRELLIEHAGEFYSLRHTSKGKLILTK